MNDKKHGKGTMIWKNGCLFSGGEFVRDKGFHTRERSNDMKHTEVYARTHARECTAADYSGGREGGHKALRTQNSS